MGTLIRASELELPHGTTLIADPDQIIVTLAAPTEEEEPEVEPAEVVDAEAPDEA